MYGHAYYYALTVTKGRIRKAGKLSALNLNIRKDTNFLERDRCHGLEISDSRTS